MKRNIPGHIIGYFLVIVFYIIVKILSIAYKPKKKRMYCRDF